MEQAITIALRVIDKLSNGGNEMTTENNKTGKKKSYVCYVYGSIYASYVGSGKTEYFIVENTMAQTWKRILNWLTEEGYIQEYQLGDTPESAGKVVIRGFNENKLIYKSYLNAIDKRLQEEQQVVA